MRLQSRVLALLGLVALGAVALQLISGALTIPQAGVRVTVVLLVLLAVERVGLPVAKSLVGPSRPLPEPDEEPVPGTPPPAAPPA